MMTIDIRSIPVDECLHIEGELRDDICQLAENDAANVAGPLKYRAEASIVSENLLLRGNFDLPFELTCCRCNHSFRHTVRLSEHSLLAPMGNLALIDLTDALREDIILALPDFPHCNNGDNQMDCPARGKFQTGKDFLPLDPKESKQLDSNSWDTLDKLKLD
jgi:uncharacterized metal-binding protein YceD (DUF177 family)